MRAGKISKSIKPSIRYMDKMKYLLLLFLLLFINCFDSVVDSEDSYIFLETESQRSGIVYVGDLFVDSIPYNKNISDNTEYEILSKPQGLELSDKVISWEPDSANLGENSVSIAIRTENNLEDTIYWTIGVIFPWIPDSNEIIKKDGMSLIKANGYSFAFGEYPNHLVRYVQSIRFTRDFWMDTTEITQEQFEAIMNYNPSYAIGTNGPVNFLTWETALLYCNERSKEAGFDTIYTYTIDSDSLGDSSINNISINYEGNGFRLPTHAEWEYAYRAGTRSVYFWGDDTTSVTVGKYAWYSQNNGGTLHSVASLEPNAYGLYDMAGNASEFCNDFFPNTATNYYSSVDPKGPSYGDHRVSKGGSTSSEVIYLSAANMIWARKNITAGFRCVRYSSETDSL